MTRGARLTRPVWCSENRRGDGGDGADGATRAAAAAAAARLL